MTSAELAGLKFRTMLSAVIGATLPLKRSGKEFKACCPFHTESTPSFTVNDEKGFFHCFGCGKRGDVFDWLAERQGMSLTDAIAHLGGDIIKDNVVVLRPADAPEWTQIIPVPTDAPQPSEEHPKNGAPSHVSRYYAADGGFVGLIYRFDPPDGKKTFAPLSFCRNGTRTQWRWQAFAKPRPLYGAELLCETGRILIVEGEKTAEAARRLLGSAMICVTWPGGANAVPHVDWSALQGRDVIIWPDADGPGRDAAAAIAIQVRHHGATARIVTLPDAPKGWDLADAERDGWQAADVLRFVDPPEPEPRDPEPEREIEHQDFVPLGHDRGRFYFFTSGGGQVRDFSSRDLQTVGSLCEMAALRYWEVNYPGKGDAGFNVRASGDALLRSCYRAGIYDAERLRGRGAWLDEGRVVLHLGDMLIVDGVETSIAAMRSKFLYEQGRRLPAIIGNEQLSSDRAKRLMDLCMAAPWEDQSSMGRMLAGWLVIAPVCGAMPWRPHIWVTGESGSGKSWIMENLIRPVVGDIGLPVSSKTTEAGVRGDLGLDARPVIFDEFESQNETDRARIQQVLDLARQASSEDGAAIVKGTQTGGSRRYRIRSCFAFLSINLGLQQAADESRTVVLTVSPDPDETRRREAFVRLQALHAEVMQPDFRFALLSRTLALLPVIRQNAEIFAAAIARSGKSRRTGDTIGVLLAGAWSLRSRALATPRQADEFIQTSDWVRQAVKRSEADPEWRRALDYLVQIPLRAPMANRAPMDIPVGEIIACSRAQYGNDPMSVSRDDAIDTLARAGLKITNDCLLIANTSEVIRRAFSSTPWASSWHATLARSPECAKPASATRFGSLVSRCLSIPLSLILGND